jgi:hypothetical protein
VEQWGVASAQWRATRRSDPDPFPKFDNGPGFGQARVIRFDNQ